MAAGGRAMDSCRCWSEGRRWVMSNYTWEPWSLRDHESAASDDRAIVGFDVQAIDGHIGKVDEANTEVGTSQIVVDTGPWIFGRKVLLPAGCIERIDWAEEQVYVDRTKNRSRARRSSRRARPGLTRPTETTSRATGEAHTVAAARRSDGGSVGCTEDPRNLP
jgi:hypothetical protein